MAATVDFVGTYTGEHSPEWRPHGCHQVLEPFLQEGSQVTVSGTDNKGRPYRRTYHGKAKR